MLGLGRNKSENREEKQSRRYGGWAAGESKLNEHLTGMGAAAVTTMPTQRVGGRGDTGKVC